VADEWSGGRGPNVSRKTVKKGGSEYTCRVREGSIRKKRSSQGVLRQSAHSDTRGSRRVSEAAVRGDIMNAADTNCLAGIIGVWGTSGGGLDVCALCTESGGRS
jgi:hypothetical protein